MCIDQYSDAGSEVRRRTGSSGKQTRLFGVPQNRRLVFFFIVFSLFSVPAFACPMCKDSTVDTGKTTTADSSGLDFNKSIYIMLGGFAGVVGFTGRAIFKAVKSSGM
jgi:hypothetical protein